MVASQQGYTDVCLELINSGADVHLQMKVMDVSSNFDVSIQCNNKAANSTVPVNGWYLEV